MSINTCIYFKEILLYRTQFCIIAVNCIHVYRQRRFGRLDFFFSFAKLSDLPADVFYPHRLWSNLLEKVRLFQTYWAHKIKLFYSGHCGSQNQWNWICISGILVLLFRVQVSSCTLCYLSLWTRRNIPKEKESYFLFLYLSQKLRHVRS